MNIRKSFEAWVSERYPDTPIEKFHQSIAEIAFAAGFNACAPRAGDIGYARHMVTWHQVGSVEQPKECVFVLVWHDEYGVAVIGSEFLTPEFPEYTHWANIPEGPDAGPSASAKQAEPMRSINSDGMLVGPDVGTGSREPVDLDGRICEHCGEGNAVLTFEDGQFASNCDMCSADCDFFLVERLNQLIAAPAPSASPAPAQGAQDSSEANHDDYCVEQFAVAMKRKLADSRAKGRSGWKTCKADHLSHMLREHCDKGDPRDVANFCMFLWAKGSSISKVPQATFDAFMATALAAEDQDEGGTAMYSLEFVRKCWDAATLAAMSREQSQ